MSIFLVMAIILVISLILIFFTQKLKQPTIIAYIVTGILINILFPHLLENASDLQTFSTLGVSLLLFITGIGMSPEVIKSSGKKNLIAGILQVFITAIAGFLLGIVLDFGLIPSLFIGIAFVSSSTIVMLKVFEEKRGMENTLWAKNALGISISQDVCIMLILMGVSTLQSIDQYGGGGAILLLIAKLIGGVIFLFLTIKVFLQPLLKYVAKSQEFLMLFALGWCFVFGATFELLGFGMEIGSLIAGISLASSFYKHEVVSRIKGIKDFFIVVFFVLLGQNFSIKNPISPGVVGIFLLFIFIIKPLIVAVILGIQGNTKKMSFLSGICFSHISEFTFIVLTFGLAKGFITDPSLIGTVTIVGLLTISGSGYMIKYGDELYSKLQKYLRFSPGFDFDMQESLLSSPSYETIIFGYSGMGKTFYENFKTSGVSSLVIDRNPRIIEHLVLEGVPCRYGDMGDVHFLESLDVQKVKILISTNKNHSDNLLFLKTMKAKNQNMMIILLATMENDALELYELGADYVILPFHMSADKTSKLLKKVKFNLDKLTKTKSRSIEDIKGKQSNLLIEQLRKY